MEKKDQNKPIGIVLDKVLSNAVRIQAYDEGFLKVDDWLEKFSKEKKDKMKFERKSYHSDFLVDQALAALVMFDKLYLDSSSSHLFMGKEHFAGGASNPLDWSELADRNAIGFCSETSGYGITDYVDEFDSNFLDQNISIFTELIYRYSVIKGVKTEIRDIYKSIANLSRFCRDIQGSNTGITIYEISDYENIAVDIYDIREAYNSLLLMLQTSNKLDIPMMGPCGSTTSYKYDTDEGVSSTLRTYRIVLEEDFSFPAPRTVKSALDLRNDKLITEVRGFVNGWSEAICNGSSDEAIFRKEIRAAKKSLSRLSLYRKIGRLVAFVSIPVAVAAALSGIPYGLVLTPIGPAIALDSIRREKKYNWLMFGKT